MRMPMDDAVVGALAVRHGRPPVAFGGSVATSSGSNSLHSFSSGMTPPAKRAIEKASIGVCDVPSTMQIGNDGADAGRELEAVAGEAEGVEEPRRGAAPADHRQHVRQVALDARPDAALAHAPEARHDLGEAGEAALDAVRRNDRRAGGEIGLHPREEAGHRLAVAPGPQKQGAVDGMQRRAGVGVLRHDREERRAGGEHRHRLAELPRQSPRPRRRRR